MAVRNVEIDCTLPYADLLELEKQSGRKLFPCVLNLRSIDDAPELTMAQDVAQEALALYYIKEDRTSHEGRVVAIEVDSNV